MQYLESFKVPPLCARAPNEKPLLFPCSTALALSKSRPSSGNVLGSGGKKTKPRQGTSAVARQPCLLPVGSPHLPARRAGEISAASVPRKPCQSPPKNRGRLMIGLAPQYLPSFSCYWCLPVTSPLFCRVTCVFSSVCLSPDSPRQSFLLRRP